MPCLDTGRGSATSSPPRRISTSPAAAPSSTAGAKGNKTERAAAGVLAAITQMAVTLTKDMLAEKPPDDGHRLNILSSTFARVGIAVYRASNGTVWMTQDFAN